MISATSFIATLALTFYCNVIVDGFGFGGRFGSTAPAIGRTTLSMNSALIVQNKGGGHGELGYQLAKTLQSNPKITSVTILQDDACDFETEPFRSYATDLPDVRVVRAPLSSGDSATMTAEEVRTILGEGESYDYVWDNVSKKPEGAARAVCDAAKDSWGTKLFTYVSSAGMYEPDADTTFPMSEATTPVKTGAGQHAFDEYAAGIGLPYVSFRPQYIYGRKSNKHDYLDWYFDRLARGRPLPIPGDGTQKVSLTNSEDVASLLASVLDDEEAAVAQRFFNCGTDRLHSYNDVARLCAAAAGIPEEEVTLRHYDGTQLGKGTYPFRLTDFYVAPDLAKSKLGWTGAKNSLADDLKWYFEGYLERGGRTKDVNFSKDDEILGAS